MTATIAVRGSASDGFPADYATVHLGYRDSAEARSDALVAGNDLIAQLRDAAASAGSGVRELRVRSMRVEATFDASGTDRPREPTGWSALVDGEMLVEPNAVATVVADLIRRGASIRHVSWHLDPHSETRARRSVRRRAVADALEAADDFAAALGATLGDLTALPVPGRRGAGRVAGGTTPWPPPAAAARATASWDDRVDLDPAAIVVSASVEARFDVILGESTTA